MREKAIDLILVFDPGFFGYDDFNYRTDQLESFVDMILRVKEFYQWKQIEDSI